METDTTKQLYNNVTSFKELLDLNVDFIEGKINWTPYHQKPIENTGPLKQTLIELNQKGFLTLGGQCGLDTPQEEKKLFLDGYLDPQFVRNFIKFLKGYPKIEYFIIINHQIKTNIRNWHVTNENQSTYFNSLARNRQNDQEEWTNKFVLPFKDTFTPTFWNPFKNILNILKDYAFVHIQHRSFHNTNNDLYDILNLFFNLNKKTEFGKGKNKLKRLKMDLKKLNQI